MPHTSSSRTDDADVDALDCWSGTCGEILPFDVFNEHNIFLSALFFLLTDSRARTNLPLILRRTPFFTEYEPSRE